MFNKGKIKLALILGILVFPKGYANNRMMLESCNHASCHPHHNHDHNHRHHDRHHNHNYNHDHDHHDRNRHFLHQPTIPQHLTSKQELQQFHKDLLVKIIMTIENYRLKYVLNEEDTEELKKYYFAEFKNLETVAIEDDHHFKWTVGSTLERLRKAKNQEEFRKIIEEKLSNYRSYREEKKPYFLALIATYDNLSFGEDSEYKKLIKVTENIINTNLKHTLEHIIANYTKSSHMDTITQLRSGGEKKLKMRISTGYSSGNTRTNNEVVVKYGIKNLSVSATLPLGSFLTTRLGGNISVLNIKNQKQLKIFDFTSDIHSHWQTGQTGFNGNLHYGLRHLKKLQQDLGLGLGVSFSGFLPHTKLRFDTDYLTTISSQLHQIIYLTPGLQLNFPWSNNIRLDINTGFSFALLQPSNHSRFNLGLDLGYKLLKMDISCSSTLDGNYTLQIGLGMVF